MTCEECTDPESEGVKKQCCVSRKDWEPEGELKDSESIQLPDRGQENVDSAWSFVVAVASFLAQGLLGGYVYTGGIYYTVFREHFPEVSTVSVSWLCTLPLTLWFIGSPLGSVLTNTFGCRTCALFGGLLASVGLTLCYFATDFYVLFLCYGVIGGLGYGVQYVGFVTAVSLYFQKYRTVVTILTTMGPTSGMAVYSFLVPRLIEAYTWKGSLVLLGGVSLNLFVCAALLFPSSASPIVKKRVFKVSVLKKKYFAFMCFQCFFVNLANSMVILHLPSLILSLGMGSGTASLSLTLYGGVNCIAKVLYSIGGHFVDANVCVVYTLSLIVCGVAIALVPVISDIRWILTFVGLLGFTYNVTGGHSLMVILDLAGQDFFSDGVGINQVFKAGGTLVAGPLAGMLYDMSHSYKISFYTGGVTMTGGCMLMIPVLIMQWRRHKQQQFESGQSIQINQNSNVEKHEQNESLL